MADNEMSAEEFLAETENAPPPVEKPGRKQSKSLVNGTIDSTPELRPEEVKEERVRLMKVLTVTRRPDQKIAKFEMTTQANKLYEIEIDEATARAIASIFDLKEVAS